MSWGGDAAWSGGGDASWKSGATEQWGASKQWSADAGASKQWSADAAWGGDGGAGAKGGWGQSAKGQGGKDQGGKGKGKEAASWTQPAAGAGKVVHPPSNQSWGGDQSWKGGNTQSWDQQAQQAWKGGDSSWGKGGAKSGGKGDAKSGGKTVAPSWGKGDAAPSGPSNEQLQASLTRLTVNLASQESITNPILESATKLLENENAPAAGLTSMVGSLEVNMTKCNELKATLTKEVADARKAGPTNPIAQDMAKVLIKCNALCSQVTEKMQKLKPKQEKAQHDADTKAKEAKDTAAFKPILAKATADVTTAVSVVIALSKQVEPLLATPPEGEELETKTVEIEKAAEEAIKKAETARHDLNEKFKAIAAYSPESKKTAHASLMELQKKLSDRIKMCHVYKAFKKEFPKLVAAQASVAEVTEKLAGHDAQILKADKIANGSKLSAEQVHEIDDTLDPVQKAIIAANSAMISKMKGCDAATMEKFNKLRARSDELKKKADAVIVKCKGQRDVIKGAEAVETAKERLAKVEEAWKDCQDAEMPFLTGVEILPDDVSEAAIKGCTEAASAAGQAISAARSWVSNHLRDAKSYESELGKKTTEALTPFSAKIHDLDTKIANFRKETNERKVTAIVAPILVSLKDFDKKVKAAEASGKGLASTTLEDETVKSIEADVVTTKAALAEANTVADDVRKVLDAKKKESKLPRDSTALTKIHDALKAGQDKLRALGTKIGAAERLVKTKNAIASGEEALKVAEADAEKSQKLVPAEGESISMEQLTALDEANATANKSIRAADDLVGPHLKEAPPKSKAALQELLTRKKAAQDVVNKTKTDTKERRQETLSTHFLAEAETKIKAVETSGAKLEETEGPFLTGASLSLKKTQEQLAKCDELAKEIDQAVKAFRDDSHKKTKQVSNFGEASSKKVKTGLAEMLERVKKVTTKLDAFNKDNRERAKEAHLLEASEKVVELEASLKATLAALEPFEKEGAADMSEEQAAEPLKAFNELERETQKQVNVCKRFVAEREKEQKGNASQLEDMKKLQERVSTAFKELTEKKKVTAPHQEKALGSQLLAQSTEQVSKLDEEIKKATNACAPLLEGGGQEFLVASSVRTLVSALKGYATLPKFNSSGYEIEAMKELDADALFKEAGGKKMKEKEFVKYLAGLPEAIERDELNAFSDERRAAIFKKVAADGKAVTQDDFKALFVTKYYCIKTVAVTNQFEIEGSETICKVEGHENNFVEITSVAKKDAKGCLRAECIVDGKKGWITLSQDGKKEDSHKGDGGKGRKEDRHKGDGGKKGWKGDPKGSGKGKGSKDGKGRDGKGSKDAKGGTTRFLVQSNPFKQFCIDADKALHEAESAVKTAAKSLETRMKQGGEAKDGSRLKECREEMAKLKEPIAKAEKEIKELSAKLKEARSEFGAKESAERNAHIVARNMKEAGPFIEGPQAKMAAVEAAAKAVEEAAAPMVTLVDKELEDFATPSAVWNNSDKQVAVLNAKAAEVREAVKEQQKAASEVTPQTDGLREAAKQLKSISHQCHEVTNKAVKASAVVRNKCIGLVKEHLDAAAEGIRKHVQDKSLSVDELFDSLKEGDKVPEEAFCKLLGSVEGLSLSAEHAKLICHKLESGGVSKDTFIKFVVIHYKVLKTIAFTDVFDIGKCKTLKKGEAGVMIEALEGPKFDEESKMTRIRGRATIDGKPVEGWITISGSAGSAFLEKVGKPANKAAKPQKK